MGLLTSSTWLDVEYGFRMQEYLLRHFRIVAVLEPEIELWFTEARINTAVTILQKEPDAARRENNLMRFVMLHKSGRDLLGETSDEPARQASADALVARVLNVTANESTDDWRVRVVSQRDLWATGTVVTLDAADLTATSNKDSDDDEEEHAAKIETADEVTEASPAT